MSVLFLNFGWTTGLCKRTGWGKSPSYSSCAGACGSSPFLYFWVVVLFETRTHQGDRILRAAGRRWDSLDAEYSEKGGNNCAPSKSMERRPDETETKRDYLARLEPEPPQDPRTVDGTPERCALLQRIPGGVGNSEWPVGVPDQNGNVVVARAGR